MPTADTGGTEYRWRRSLADRLVVVVKLLLLGWGWSEGAGSPGMFVSINRAREGAGRKRGSMPRRKEKPFAIPKLLVWEAWRQVKANKGAPGVDGQDLEQFEADLEDNLYRIWNRMSSGSYFPPPVRAVEIPKPHGRGAGCWGTDDR